VAASPIVRGNLDLLASQALKRAKLLDFGCGHGIYRLLLERDGRFDGWSYAGVEADRELVDVCRSLHAGVRFDVGGEAVEAVGFEPGAFDVTLASGSLQYCRDVGRVLRWLRRVTRDCVVISRLLTWEGWPSAVVRQTVEDDCGVVRQALHVFERRTFERELAALGFVGVGRAFERFRIPITGADTPAVPTAYVARCATAL
jgi:SAM-dependent methyltransferase